MKTIHSFIIACTVVICTACNGTQSRKGVLIDATMNTVTILGTNGDTLSFSTMNADRSQSESLQINDTLEVFFNGKYENGMAASKLILYPKNELIGGKRDAHGCLSSAGYTWSEVRKDCIRLFESGIRTKATDGSGRTVFIVFSSDSTKTELFFSDNQPTEILDRRQLASGRYAWNIEDDDTKNVRLIDGVWTISQRDSVIYREESPFNRPELGKTQVNTYEGLLPAASCPGIVYTLITKNQEHSGDGIFTLILTYKEAEDGQDKTFTCFGKRFTQRGMPGDNDATVWQCVSEDKNTTFNFLVKDESTLILLNDKFESNSPEENFTLKRLDKEG